MRVIHVLLLGLAAVATPIYASQWVEVGNKVASSGEPAIDKVMVDTDSIQNIDQFRVVDIMTLRRETARRSDS